MKLTVYLAGEVHSDWRDDLKKVAADKGLEIDFLGPVAEHDLSDDIGAKIVGDQPNDYWHDHVGASVNNFRNTILMNQADAVIAKFGEDYQQWNTAMDATTAINLGKPIVLIRPESKSHALKELSAKAHLTVETIDQAVQVLEYALR